MKNYLVALCLIIILAAIIIKMIKDFRNGKSSCGCSCSFCSMQDSCKDRFEKKEG